MLEGYELRRSVKFGMFSLLNEYYVICLEHVDVIVINRWL